jgi:hypothetical protein
MLLRYVPIVKAKKGEFDALANTSDDVARRIMPLFEVGRLTQAIVERKWYKTSRTPKIAYLGRVVDGIAAAWGDRPAMVDGYLLPPDASTEQGEHMIAHTVMNLEEAGTPVVPVIGYDRWENEVYQAAMKGLSAGGKRAFCLRIDSQSLDDAAEPEFFKDNVAEILDGMGLPPSKCSVLIDFGDVTSTGISDLVTVAGRVITQLNEFGFRRFITAGCSIPKSIDLAVQDTDSSALLVRRELLLWEALRQEFRNRRIIYGDYGVRGPNTNDDIRSNNTNGKIRHTTQQQYYVARGHAITKDGSAVQMHALARDVVQSGHYLGVDFSWGDERIDACRQHLFTGSPTTWIAIDTNHHLAYVTQEVEEFERSIVVTDAGAEPENETT